jgi:MFS transporter, UMF1 family
VPVKAISKMDGHNDEASGDDTVPFPPPLHSALLHVPSFFRYDKGPLEATGLNIDFYARATILMSSIFLGPALLQLATDAAGCDSEEICNNRIYGMKPSSLLSNIAIFSNLLVAILMPLFGAIVDHTPYRRQVGMYSAFSLTVLKGIESMISSKTWFAIACFQVLSYILYNIHITSTYAYGSELSNNHTAQAKYNTFFYVVLYISTVIFLVMVLLIAFAVNADDITTARIALILTTATCAILFPFTWTNFFTDRPAKSTIPKGHSLVTSGFQKLKQTSKRICHDLPALRYVMLSIMFSEAATGALITISTTYMTQFLNMDASELGVIFFIILSMGAPGSKLAELLAISVNPLFAAKVLVILFIVVTFTAAVVLTGQDRKQYSAIFAVFWGLGLGGLHPMHSTLFMTISPTGQETEMMGTYIFAGQVLAWLPPLLFTILNEVGVSMSVGMLSLDIFFCIAFIFLGLIGDYHKALDHSRTSVTEAEAPQENFEILGIV